MSFNCLITNIIRNTLSICNYTLCDQNCSDYLLDVANQCPVVFHNEKYTELWNTLFHICLSDGGDLIIQSH